MRGEIAQPGRTGAITAMSIMSRVIEGRRLGQLPPLPPRNATQTDTPEQADTPMPDAPTDDFADAEVQCAICLEDYVQGDYVATLGCGHRFHGNCLQLWITAAGSEPRCP